jgi:hypothetical protein
MRRKLCQRDYLKKLIFLKYWKNSPKFPLTHPMYIGGVPLTLSDELLIMKFDINSSDGTIGFGFNSFDNHLRSFLRVHGCDQRS